MGDQRAQDQAGDRDLPAPLALLQAAQEHWFLRLPGVTRYIYICDHLVTEVTRLFIISDLPSLYPHRGALLGLLLDQPRGHQRQGSLR